MANVDSLQVQHGVEGSTGTFSGLVTIASITGAQVNAGTVTTSGLATLSSAQIVNGIVASTGSFSGLLKISSITGANVYVDQIASPTAHREESEA